MSNLQANPVEQNIILQAKNLGKTYRDGLINTEVLQGIDLVLHSRERKAIVGASGSGKSTLLHLLAGLDKPSTGEVKLAGQDFSSLSETKRGILRNQNMGFVYQFHYLLAELSALENVMLPLRVARQSASSAEKQAVDLLKQVGLGHRLQHKPSELSGGERQRVAMARALITRPGCILADEPTGNLDSKSAEQVFELMLSLNEEFDTALLVVTHDLDLAAQIGETITMVDGRILQPKAV
ncbi:MAG: lipoprotein-releasing ABC transporter ATP-binding protein LolD [Thiomicrospira sp.]|uniref:lipoprotein-releasing ABC transporter ATP-binding protein LolD n=1 Tax=Thiomicrospira sp. TaxID=935 RepID=UPI0019E8C3C7|nr:lipoprotein-releasing ABC transporter ATP-binding protein LolD [Thiomicrospira sp.]MBE0493886.1 lipoprotein-releasing ABC transporter ATP-binding protein LolD [Thiomicrospira sp.]